MLSISIVMAIIVIIAIGASASQGGGNQANETTKSTDGSTTTQTLFMAKPGITKDQPILFKPLSVEIMEDDAVWIRWQVGEKVDFDFDNDPTYKEVMGMIEAHK